MCNRLRSEQVRPCVQKLPLLQSINFLFTFSATVLRFFVRDSYKAVLVFHSEDNARMSVTGSYASSSSPLFLIMLPSLSLSLSPSL
ncbi:unnamed protein product [Hymenolepis diminuta]|uniref:Uncharacterized protein n=1 Tax=Hymenolepis diminuta TaxID=6216 RepID=A0A564ZC16_HYMDI|nr:unnamed protein product [Hymenolepis diminuta]